MTTNCKTYLATVAGAIVFVGVGQWLISPDGAPAAIACATISIAPCVAHWLMAARVSKTVLQAALLWIPILIFVALWILGHSLPNNEGQHQIVGFFIAYAFVCWLGTSLVLLCGGGTSKAVNN